MDLIGIRGAVCARRNGREEILEATRRLLEEIERRNLLERRDVVSALFTMTPDLYAAFPAAAARELGWGDVPMLGACEVAVPGAPERTIRVLLHVRAPGPARHVYLGETARLRPDLLPAGLPAAVGSPAGHGSDVPGGSGGSPGEPAAPIGTLLVIGLGLIGGSLALAARRAGAARRVLGVDRDPAALEAARLRAAVDETGPDADGLLPRAEVILLALPVLEAVRWLGERGPALSPGQVVVDVGSTKRAVLEAMDRLPAGVEAIGAHPMGGSERGGMRAAGADLLRGAVWALVRGRRTGPRAEAAAHALLEASGGTALGIAADRHDAAVALTSHLPYLLSAALALHAAGSRDGELVRSLAGPGLRDTTRLAGTGPAMMAEILRTNWPNVRAEARGFLSRMEGLLSQIERTLPGDPAPILEGALRARARLFPP